MAAALSLTVTACTGATTTTTVATTLPPPTTTTTVATTTTAAPDPVEVFLDTILDPAFAAAARLEGQLTVGEKETPVAGSAILTPEGYWEIFEIEGQEATETLVIGDEEWERSGGGPWVTEPPGESSANSSAEEANFLRTLKAITEVELEGEATEGGVTYLRLVPPPDKVPTLEELGIDASGRSNFEWRFEFLATPEGTPSAVRHFLGWFQDVEGTETEVDLVLTYWFEGEPGLLPTVEEEWYHFGSTVYGYAIAHPAAWEPIWDEQADDGFEEYFLAPDGSWAQVWFEEVGEVMTLNEASSFVHQGAEYYGDEVDSNEEYELLGRPARLITGTGEDDDGLPYGFAVAVTPVDTVALQLVMVDFDGSIDAADLELFDGLAATFELVPAAGFVEAAE